MSNPNTYEKRRIQAAKYQAEIKRLKNNLQASRELISKQSEALRTLKSKIIRISNQAEKDGKLSDELINLSIAAHF